jgi:hypothetical protein
LINELNGILRVLPLEVPTGIQDIYGIDTSIAWFGRNLVWRNGSPEGCVQGVSQVQANDAQKRMFKRAVEIVEQLVGQGAATSGS